MIPELVSERAVNSQADAAQRCEKSNVSDEPSKEYPRPELYEATLSRLPGRPAAAARAPLLLLRTGLALALASMLAMSSTTRDSV
eukprot:6179438-Pleurochrysis_carterae.AAC.3